MKTIPYGKQYINKRDIDEVVRVLKSDWITQGPKVAEFEEKLAGICGARYAVAVSSGTAALHLACLAAELKKGDEAVTSPITFLATANAVLYTGAKPVFADIDYETININPEAIARKIGKRTRAILPVHFGGLPCDMEKISRLARAKRIVVIEDACHVLGAQYKTDGKWIKIGSCRHSDMTVFSFHPVKHITTGEGGAITTNNRAIYNKLRALRSHGVYKSDAMARKYGAWYYEMRELGFNYRITDFQCALGLSQLRRIKQVLIKRREIAKYYTKALSRVKEIVLPHEDNDKHSAWHLYPIRIVARGNNRNSADLKRRHKRVFDFMRKSGINVQTHYIPVYLQPYYRNIGYKKGTCPNAEMFYQTEMSIPLYPELRKSDLRRVVSTLVKAVSIR